MPVPMWVFQVLKLLEIATPVLYAAATYWVFHRLDQRASGPAKKAISDWLASTRYDKASVAGALVEVFDRVYTKPLLGWQAFLRSVLFTTVITAVFVNHLYPAFWWMIKIVPEMRSQWASQFLTNIIADYLALFLIRRWLIIGGNHPLFALITGPLLGLGLIVLAYLVRDVGGFSMMTRSFSFWYFIDDIQWWWGAVYRQSSVARALLFPAVAVHLWLPLFAFAVIVAQGLNYTLSAGLWIQWFIKRGKDHPLQALGYVAAAIVFCISVAYQVSKAV